MAEGANKRESMAESMPQALRSAKRRLPPLSACCLSVPICEKLADTTIGRDHKRTCRWWVVPKRAWPLHTGTNRNGKRWSAGSGAGADRTKLRQRLDHAHGGKTLR